MGESSILVDHRFQYFVSSAYYVMRDESTIECHPELNFVILRSRSE